MSDLRARVLAEIERREGLLAQGTPLPWMGGGGPNACYVTAGYTVVASVWGGENPHADSALITTAANGLPALLAHCRDVYDRHKDAPHAVFDGCHSGGCCIGCGRFDGAPLHRSAVDDCPELLSVARALGVAK